MQLRQSWLHYEALRPADQINHIEAVVNRLETLLAPAFMQRMLSSAQTTIPLIESLTTKLSLLSRCGPAKMC
jgi:hypothetical protein